MFQDRKTFRGLTLASVGSAAALSLAASAQASVVTDPTLMQGPTAIDPVSTNDQEIDTRVGTASEATLEANPDFYVVQDFPGFEGIGTGGSNYLSFTGPNENKFLDARFNVSHGGNTPSPRSGGETNNNSDSRSSSADSFILMKQDYSNTTRQTLRIHFGDYDASSGTFTPLSQGGLSAASLVGARIRDKIRMVVFFKDAQGNTLSEQEVGSINYFDDDDPDPGDDKGLDALFSYQDSGSGKVATIQITRFSRTSGANGVDDLGFTAVPEPASLALLGLGGGLMVFRRRGNRAAA